MENLNSAIDPMAVASQGVEEIIKRLKEKSHYKREQIAPDQEKLISSEEEIFLIERVRDGEDPAVKKIFDFVKKFDPKEADTLDIIRDAIKNDIYAYHVVENADKKIVAHAQSSFLEISKKIGEGFPEAVLFIGYSVTDGDFQRKGLASEMFQSIVKIGAEKARFEKKVFKGIIGEATSTSERFWNSVGLKRIYFEDSKGDVCEVPYVCPPIQWDKNTGRPLDPETGAIGDKDIKKYSAPEHLMIGLTDERKGVTVDELMAMIEVIYQDNYVLYRNFDEKHPTDEAIEYSRKVVDNFKKEIEGLLSFAKDGKIFLLSIEEREEKKKELAKSSKNFNELKTDN